jgi:hypothetical protein
MSNTEEFIKQKGEKLAINLLINSKNKSQKNSKGTDS